MPAACLPARAAANPRAHATTSDVDRPCTHHIAMRSLCYNRRSMTHMKSLLVVLLAAGIFSAACKRTVEGEDQAWTANLKRAQDLAAQYPSFAGALREQQKRAEDAMTQARAVSDKEQAAKQMGAANAILNEGFASTLSQVEPRTRALRQKLVDAT